MALRKRDPRTKEELLDRMLSYDFDGDIRNLGAEPATIKRVGANLLRLRFPATDTVFDLSIHRPREFAKAAQRASEERSFVSEEEPEIVADESATPRRRTRSVIDHGDPPGRRHASN